MDSYARYLDIDPHKLSSEIHVDTLDYMIQIGMITTHKTIFGKKTILLGGTPLDKPIPVSFTGVSQVSSALKSVTHKIGSPACNWQMVLTFNDLKDIYQWYSLKDTKLIALESSSDVYPGGAYHVQFDQLASETSVTLTNAYNRQQTISLANCPPQIVTEFTSTDVLSVFVDKLLPYMVLTITSLNDFDQGALTYDYGTTSVNPQPLIPTDTEKNGSQFTYRFVIPKPPIQSTTVRVSCNQFPNSFLSKSGLDITTLPYSTPSTPVVRCAPFPLPSYIVGNNNLFKSSLASMPDILCHFSATFDDSFTGIDSILYSTSYSTKPTSVDRNIYQKDYSHYFTIPYIQVNQQPVYSFTVDVKALYINGIVKDIISSPQTFNYNPTAANPPTDDSLPLATAYCLARVGNPGLCTSSVMSIIPLPFMVTPRADDAFDPRIPGIDQQILYPSNNRHDFPFGFSQTAQTPRFQYDFAILPYASKMKYSLSNTNAVYFFNTPNYNQQNVIIDLTNPTFHINISSNNGSTSDFILYATVNDDSGIAPNSCQVNIGSKTLFLNPEYLMNGHAKSGDYRVPFSYNYKAFCKDPVTFDCVDIIGNRVKLDSSMFFGDGSQELSQFTLPQCPNTVVSNSRLLYFTTYLATDRSLMALAVLSGIQSNSDLQPTLKSNNQTFYYSLSYGPGEDNITLSTEDIDFLTKGDGISFPSSTPAPLDYKPVVSDNTNLLVESDTSVTLLTSIMCNVASISFTYTADFMTERFSFVPPTTNCDATQRYAVHTLKPDQVNKDYSVHIDQVCDLNGNCERFPMFGSVYTYNDDSGVHLTPPVTATISLDTDTAVDVSAKSSSRILGISVKVDIPVVLNSAASPLLSILDTNRQIEIPLNWGATAINRPSDSFIFYISNLVTVYGYYTHMPFEIQPKFSTYSSSLRDNTPNIWTVSPTLERDADQTITLTGSNLGVSITYNIQGKPVQPTIIDNSHLVFQVDPLGLNYSQPINLTIDSGFSCDCSGHGTCSSLLCNCDDGFSGSKCEVDLTKTNAGMDMTPNITAPTVIFTDIIMPHNDTLTEYSKQTSFSIHIHSIREFDIFNQLVELYDSTNLTWSKTDSNASWVTYRHNFASPNSFVSVRVDMYKDGGSTVWANDTITFAPSSTKYTVRFENYKFSSMLNHLVVVFESTSTAPCATRNESNISWGASTPEDMHWFIIPQHQLSLYGRFTNKVIVDGKVSSTANSIISKAEPLLIGVTVPYFQLYSEVDPDF
eukprot:gene20054-24050_t